MKSTKSYPMRVHNWSVKTTVDKTGLWIARMQPLHLGHIDAIKQAFELGIEKLLIGIWSANKNGTAENPFWIEERKRMLLEVLTAEGLQDKCSIFLIMDTDNDTLRRKKIDKEVEPFSKLVSDNWYLSYLFPDKEFVRSEMRVQARWTVIREAIVDREFERLATMLHPTTMAILDEIKAYDTITKLLVGKEPKITNASDLVIKNNEDKVALIKRAHAPKGWALVGGKMKANETALETALREGLEEVGGLPEDAEFERKWRFAKYGDVEIEVVRRLSYRDKVKRDDRGRFVTYPFEARLISWELIAGSDAKEVHRLSMNEIEMIQPEDWAFKDHPHIIRESFGIYTDEEMDDTCSSANEEAA